MCHDGTCSNNYIIADPGIAENNAIGSDKNVISDSNNAYLSMSPGFSCTRIMCKYPYDCWTAITSSPTEISHANLHLWDNRHSI